MSASDSTRFGAMLREARRGKGLSQAELGGDKYTGSYISHLESGRRLPNAEVLDFLSRRLGMSPLEWGVSPAGDPGQVVNGDPIEQLLVAERAWSQHDWGAAIEYASQAAVAATEAGDAGRYWESRYVLAQARFSSGQFAEAAEIAEELAEHDTAKRFAVARAQALSLASVSHRASDHLGWAVAFGARAVESAMVAPPIILAEALMSLVSALFEAGSPPSESEPYLERLRVISGRLHSPHSRGMISWTIGTAACMSGDITGGLAAYDQAGELLDPRRDIRLWSRFHRSAARVRLDAGITEGVAEHLRTGSLGIEVFGNNHDVVELRQAEAKLEMLSGRPQAGARTMADVLADPVLGAPEMSLGNSLLVLAECLDAAGEPAQDAFRSAAEQLETEGRLRQSLDAWKRAVGKVSMDQV